MKLDIEQFIFGALSGNFQGQRCGHPTSFKSINRQWCFLPAPRMASETATSEPLQRAESLHSRAHRSD